MNSYKIGAFAGNDIRIQGHGIDPVHAIIYQDEEGDILIEDKASKQGTFVQNIPIKRYRLKSSDKIRLGSVPFDLMANFKIKNDQLLGIRSMNDFTEEFKELKAVWEEYIGRTVDLGKMTGKQQRIKQIFSSLGTLGLILGMAIPSLPVALRIVMMGIGALAAIYFVFITTSAKNISKKQKDKEDLLLHLTKTYVCPKCQVPLPKQPFEILKESKKHNCGAIWVK